jgi:Fur family peroxide stress response transcriptional regulator
MAKKGPGKGDGELMDSFREKCRNNGLKITPQRLAIYREVVRSREHPSADKVYRNVRKVFPNISFDTVNRSLVTFSRMGVISVVEGYGEAKRFDPNLEGHHHFRCMRCNNIIDFYDKTLDAVKVPREIQRRFKVLHKRIVLEGLCDACSKKG